MSELGDYRRLVEKPMIASYEVQLAELRKELGRCRDLRAKLEVQSMQAMDQLRAQIRTLGAEPVL